jgi:hypothetical protein
MREKTSEKKKGIIDSVKDGTVVHWRFPMMIVMAAVRVKRESLHLLP